MNTAIRRLGAAGLAAAGLIVTLGLASAQPVAVEGRFLRGDPADSHRGQSHYQGGHTSVRHPFTAQTLPVYTSGRYTTAVGVVFDGEFEFVPVRDTLAGQSLGVYIFVGARIDRELDEVREGLFISDPVGATENIVFHRARPDYVLHLQRQFQTQLSAVAAEQAEKQAASESRRAAFGLIIDIVSGVANVRALQKGGSVNPLAREALSALRGAVTGEQTPEAAMNQLMGSLAARVGDKLLRGQPVQAAEGGNLKAALQAAGRQMARQSLQQYEASLRPAAGGSADTR